MLYTMGGIGGILTNIQQPSCILIGLIHFLWHGMKLYSSEPAIINKTAAMHSWTASRVLGEENYSKSQEEP